MDLFIPGRLCLLGEHSDWAAQYHHLNSTIDPGFAIVVGTNQGIYARVKPHSRLLCKSVYQTSSLDLEMNLALLLEMAQADNFYSYIAGVAYEALKRYGVRGISIDNYAMDLPLKKGLSSSAAICVLVARAFNLIYGLRLTTEAEMDLAYWGERHTSSQCGKLDQACAYGKQPILMTFDHEQLRITPLTVGQELNFIIVDLAGNKNTKAILAQLNQCYPIAHNAIQAGVQNYLGKINAEITQQAAAAIQEGNKVKIGNLMNKAQAEFDRYLIPACPSELTAPILHQLLNYAPLQKYVYGGKGVGSQGDGTAEFLASDRHSQKKAIAMIKQNFLQMQCYELNISKTEAEDYN